MVKVYVLSPQIEEQVTDAHQNSYNQRDRQYKMLSLWTNWLSCIAAEHKQYNRFEYLFGNF